MVPLALFGINASEFVILAVLAVIFFGPERIPALSRKAARVVFFLRNIANDATKQLKDELGPEYQDLDINDFNPKNFVKKHLLDDLQDELDGVKSDLESVKADLGAAGGEVTSALNDLNQTVQDQPKPVSVSASSPASEHRDIHFDMDAT